MKIERRQIPLLITGCLSNTMVGLGQQVIHKEIVSNIPSQYLSFEQVLFCVSIMVSAGIWEKIQSFMLRNFVTLEIIETILLTIFYIYFYNKWNPYAFYIIELIYCVLVGGILGRCSVTMKVMLFPIQQEQINSQNNTEFFNSIACIIGFGIATIIALPLPICLILFWIADLIRTAGYVYTRLIYKEYFI